MDSANAGGNHGGYSGYGGVNGGINNGGSDFEARFRNMVVASGSDKQYTEALSPENSPIQEKRKNGLALIVMVTLAVIGAIGVVITAGIYVGALVEKRNNEELEASLAVDEQDDAVFYKDLSFSAEGVSNIPILVYAAVKNGEAISVDWLEEFKTASERYSNNYNNRLPIPRDATFEEVTVESDLVGELYPNVGIRRFILETSEGCARFDFYDDLLVIYDYEFLKQKCAGVEWNVLKGDETTN